MISRPEIPEQCEPCEPLQAVLDAPLPGLYGATPATGKEIVSCGGNAVSIRRGEAPQYAMLSDGTRASTAEISLAHFNATSARQARDRKIADMTEGCPGMKEVQAIHDGRMYCAKICGNLFLKQFKPVED